MTLQEKDLKDRSITIGKKPYLVAIDKINYKTYAVNKRVRDELRTRLIAERLLIIRKLLIIRNHLCDYIIF